MSLHSIMAVARLTIRDATRSRMLLSLALILVMGLLGLPALITDDNSSAGQIQIVLSYSLRFAGSVLALVTLWSACGGLAADIRDRRLYLVLAKPLHRYELWIGKWLGIVSLNAALLVLSGGVIILMVEQVLQRASRSDAGAAHLAAERYWVAHQPRQAITPDWRSEAGSTLDQLVREGRLPASLDRERGIGELAPKLRNRYFAVAPCSNLTLRFGLPRSATGSHDVLLVYQFESSRPERAPVPLRWTIRSGALTHELSVTNYPGLPDLVAIPAGWVQGADELVLSLYRQPSPNPATIMLNAGKHEPELLIPSGHAGSNLARGMVMILAQLGFVAALGLAAGSLLSVPVALFTCFFILVMMALAGYVETVATTGMFFIPHEGPAPEQNMLNTAILHLFKLFNLVTGPLLAFDPVPAIEEGLHLSLSLVAQAVAWLVGAYSTFTAAIAIMLFNRRELG